MPATIRMRVGSGGRRAPTSQAAFEARSARVVRFGYRQSISVPEPYPSGVEPRNHAARREPGCASNEARPTSRRADPGKLAGMHCRFSELRVIWV